MKSKGISIDYLNDYAEDHEQKLFFQKKISVMNETEKIMNSFSNESKVEEKNLSKIEKIFSV